MDALEDLVRQVERAEDEVYEQLVDDLQIEGINMHSSQNDSLLSFSPSSGNLAMQNLVLIKEHIASLDEHDDQRNEFVNLHSELHALMGARVEAFNA